MKTCILILILVSIISFSSCGRSCSTAADCGTYIQSGKLTWLRKFKIRHRTSWYQYTKKCVKQKCKEEVVLTKALTSFEENETEIALNGDDEEETGYGVQGLAVCGVMGLAAGALLAKYNQRKE